MNLFGQSAGAEDAFIISSLPKAPQLINSFTSESGGGKNVAANATLQATGANYASILECGSSDVRPNPYNHFFFRDANFSVEILPSIQVCERPR